MNLKLIGLIRQRDRAESRMSKSQHDKNRYSNPSIHKYERDIAQELIDEELPQEVKASK